MNTKGLIYNLYNKQECEAIEKLYHEKSLRKLIVDAIATKLITLNENVIDVNLLNSMYVICLTAKFANSEDECYRVAVTLCQFYNKTKNILPSIEMDRGLEFANKTLIALSLYPQAIEKKWKYHGAPSINFYRNTSKHIYTLHDQFDISNHHEQWEKFLGERLI